VVTITTSSSFALANIGGKRYVVPQWIEVPLGTTLADVKVVRPDPPVNAVTIVKEEYITGSKGDEYLVKVLSDGSGTCECWGYRRRKDCKHLKALRNT